MTSVKFSCHPIQGVNFVPFKSCCESDMTNCPHFTNGPYHLYFRDGTWYISTNFSPESTSCLSYLEDDITDEGDFPTVTTLLGKKRWRVVDSVGGCSSAEAVCQRVDISPEKESLTCLNTIEPLICHEREFQGAPLLFRNEYISRMSQGSAAIDLINGFSVVSNFKRWLETTSSFIRNCGNTCARNMFQCSAQHFMAINASLGYFHASRDEFNQWSTPYITCVIGLVNGTAITRVQPMLSQGRVLVEACTVWFCGFMHALRSTIGQYFQPIRVQNETKCFLFRDPTTEIEELCAQRDALFVDSFFPRHQLGDGRTWMRLGLLTDAPYIFDDTLSDSISQGNLGNCYLCAALACIARQRPDIIRAVFCQRSMLSNYGVVALRLWDEHTAAFRFVVVDDFVPTKNNVPCFASSKDCNELWCALLEKALAKVNGADYARIDAENRDCRCSTYSIFALLTGSHDVVQWKYALKSDTTKTVQVITNAVKKHWPICTGTSRDEEDSLVRDEIDSATGLVMGHAYTIVGIWTLQECGTTLVRVKNPWGRQGWVGAWGNYCERWSPQTLAEVADNADMAGPPLKVNDENDGTFFIPISDFCIHFHQITVVRRIQEADVCAAVLSVKISHSDFNCISGFYYVAKNKVINGHPCFKRDHNSHLYFKEGSWMLSDRLDNSSCFLLGEAEFDGKFPLHKTKWRSPGTDGIFSYYDVEIENAHHQCILL